METTNYEFTKEHTGIAKGIAITLMMIHHLFRFPDRIQDVSYISMLHLGNIKFEYLMGDFGNICIAMYLFLSGYGLYMSSLKKDNFTLRDSVGKSIKFLTNYWVVFIVFVPIGLIWFSGAPRYHFNILNFMANFTTLSSSYNSEWWFVRLYIELLLIFPIIKRILKKGLIASSLISFSLYILAIIMELIPVIATQLAFLKKSFIYGDIRNILFWQITFSIGCIISKYKLFEQLNKWISKKRLNKNFFYVVIVIAIMAVRIFAGYAFNFIGKGNPTYVDFVLAPIFILICTNLIYKINGKKVFMTLGKHSMNMWLTHTFFCYYYFQSLVFMPKLSILILIWLATLSICSSILINFIIKISKHILQKRIYYIDEKVV